MEQIKYQVVNGTYYHISTPNDLINKLEAIRNNRQRVILYYGNVETGEFWESATPERGTIGRSMGPVKIPLLIRTYRSYGGEGILDHCILKIIESIGGRVIYNRKCGEEK